MYGTSAARLAPVARSVVSIYPFSQNDGIFQTGLHNFLRMLKNFRVDSYVTNPFRATIIIG